MVNWQGIGSTYFPAYNMYFNVDDACNVWQKICTKNKKPDEMLCNLFHQIVTTSSGWKKDTFGPGHPLTALAHRGLEMIRAKKIAVSDVDVARFYQWLAWMEEEEEEAAIGRRPTPDVISQPSLPHKPPMPPPAPTPSTDDPALLLDQALPVDAVFLEDYSTSLNSIAPLAGGFFTVLAVFISAFAIPQLLGGEDNSVELAQTRHSFKIGKPCYGSGIENKEKNVCYINSILQALRNVPAFTHYCNSLKTDSLSSASRELLQQLQHIYAVIEGQSGEEQRVISNDEILEFQKTLIEKNEWYGKFNEQMDAAEFMLFLLQKLGIQPFHYFQHVQRNLNIPLVSLDKVQHNTLLSLSITHNEQERTIQDLLCRNKTLEEIDKKNIQNSEWYRDKYTPEQKQIINDLSEELHTISTTQTIQFLSEHNDIPEVLPIQLKRFSYDITSQQSARTDDEIVPSENIEIPIVDANKHIVGKVEYALCAIVVRSGSASISAGHYCTYAPKKIGDKTIWVQFDDNNVLLHEQIGPVTEGLNPLEQQFVSEASVSGDIKKHGYLFVYTRKKEGV